MPLDVNQIKTLSDPNRLAILALMTMRETTTTEAANILGLSVQNASYHIKKLLNADVINETRTEMVGNLVERYYHSVFKPGDIDQTTHREDVDIDERLALILSALGAIKGVLNHGIAMIDDRLEYMRNIDSRVMYPFNANQIIVSNTADCREEADRIADDMNERMGQMVEGDTGDGDGRFAVIYAVFPYD